MKSFRLAAAAVSVSLCGLAGSVSAEVLKAEGGSAAGLSALVPQLMSKYAAENHEIRVNVDQTLTRAALKAASGSIDMAITPAGAYHKMTQGKGPYKKLADKAVAASGDMRSLFSFLGGHVHAMT